MSGSMDRISAEAAAQLLPIRIGTIARRDDINRLHARRSDDGGMVSVGALVHTNSRALLATAHPDEEHEPEEVSMVTSGQVNDLHSYIYGLGRHLVCREMS